MTLPQRRVRAVAIGMALMVGAMLLVWATGSAATSCIAPSTALEVDSTPAGSDVLVRGAAWTTCNDVSTVPPESSNASQPLTDIGIWLVGVPNGPIELARVDAQDDGRFAVEVTIPQDTPTGDVVIVGASAEQTPSNDLGDYGEYDEGRLSITDLERAVARAYGADRIMTAIEVSKRNFPDGAETVYLARADVPFDAMVASTATDGPVLLVPVGCRIPVFVSNEISRLGPDLVVGLGGPAVICDHVLEVAARQPDFSN